MCNRPLIAPAVSVNTKGGAKAWGPKCAKKAGLLDAAKRAFAAQIRQGEADPRQLALEL